MYSQLYVTQRLLMKRYLYIGALSVMTALLISGCSDATEHVVEVEDGVATEDFAYSSALVSRSNSAKVALASQYTSQDVADVNQNSAFADVLFFLALKEEFSNGVGIEPHLLYDYFVTHYVETGSLSEEDLRIFNEMQISQFNEAFIESYFVDEGEDSFYDLNPYLYMSALFDSSDAVKSTIAEKVFDIVLDYPNIVSDVASFVYYVRFDAVNVLSEALYQARLHNPSITTKIEVLLENDPLVMESIFGQLFTEAHSQYHRDHIDKAMYTAMTDALFKSSASIDNSATAEHLYNEESLVLPEQEGIRENQDAFAKQFFDIGTTAKNDGNELATQKLLLKWSFSGVISPFYNTEGTSAYEENEVAYLDFMYLGLSPLNEEADSRQATYFSFARESGLNAKSVYAATITNEIEVFEETRTEYFARNYLLPAYNVTQAGSRLVLLYESIPVSRYLPYAYQYIESNYLYYDANTTQDQELLSNYVTDAFSYLNDNIESNNFAPQRSGGIDLEGAYITLVEAYNRFTGLSFGDQISFMVDYFFFEVDTEAYFGERNTTEGYETYISGDDLNLSDIVTGANDAWLVDVATQGYSDIALYHQGLTWDYLPPKLLNSQYLVLDESSKAFEFDFDFSDGSVIIYFISQESATQLQAYDPRIRLARQDTILSQERSALYKLYGMEIKPFNRNTTVNFNELSDHVEAIFIEKSYLYKTQE